MSTETDIEATDAAVAEAKDDMTRVEYEGQTFEFKSKRINAVQFKLQMQKNRDAAAIEWLLGPKQFGEFLTATADEDGCTNEDVYAGLIEAIGKAVGSGNS